MKDKMETPSKGRRTKREQIKSIHRKKISTYGKTEKTRGEFVKKQPTNVEISMGDYNDFTV
jgi:hypothetical protein